MKISLPRTHAPNIWAQMFDEMSLPGNYGNPILTYDDLVEETTAAAFAALAVLGPGE